MPWARGLDGTRLVDGDDTHQTDIPTGLLAAAQTGPLVVGPRLTAARVPASGDPRRSRVSRQGRESEPGKNPGTRGGSSNRDRGFQHGCPRSAGRFDGESQ
jgi:hypothetical protein